MSAIDTKLRRLAARGYYEISPASGDQVHIAWAPTGQAGPGGKWRFNPFCTRGAIGRLEDALDELLDVTEPRRRDLDDLVGERWWRRAEIVAALMGSPVVWWAS